MKALLWQGQRIDTTDDVADTAFELARLLVSFGRTERLDLPVAMNGRATTCSLVVGSGIGLGVLALPGEPDRALPGDDVAIADMQARIARLDDAPGANDFHLPEDFSVLDHDITT